ncbi:MAG: hypothetical protein ACK57K_02255 [Chryseotalea sp.]
MHPTGVDVVFWHVGRSSVPITECVCVEKVNYTFQHAWHGRNFRARWARKSITISSPTSPIRFENSPIV